MPFIDGNGKIVGMQLSNTTSLVTIAQIESLENQIPLTQGTTLSQKLASNTLSSLWDSGIIQYEQGNYQGAIQTLNSIQNAPSAFKAPAAFIDKAEAKLPQVGTRGPSSSSHAGSNQSGSLWLIVIGLIVGIVAFILLFLLVSINFGRKRIERKRELDSFEADLTEARRRIEEEERQKYVPPLQPYAEVDKYSVATTAELRCPNCGVLVDEHAVFCPNCRYSLKPTNVESYRSPSPPAALAPTSADVYPTVQPQQPARVPKMQDDPAIQAALQRLWDRAGR
jgi:hypothetical protein